MSHSKQPTGTGRRRFLQTTGALLAAGRTAWTKGSVERAFQYAFQSIKPTDGVIIGMFPRYYDEIRDNVAYTRRFGKR